MDLKSGCTMSMCSAPGEVLVIKSTRFDFEPHKKARTQEEMHLDLQNEPGDILLRITLRTGTKKIFFNDRAWKSLGDGWGKEQSASLESVCGDPGVKITVHNCSTSEHNCYQILVGLTTVGYFDSRISGTSTNITYTNKNIWQKKGFYLETFAVMSSSLKVRRYKIADLLPEERQALNWEAVPSPGNPALNSTAISIRPSHFIPNQTFASIIWDDGREIRNYYLGPENILHEYAYSASKDKNSWYYGDLHKLNITLDPTSSIAAVRHNDDGICILFQGWCYPSDGSIRSLRQRIQTGEWRIDLAGVARAVKGSSIAIVPSAEGPAWYRAFYQDPKLHLREHYLIPSSHGFVGEFNPGVQPRGTLITAEVVNGGSVDINVTWRDEEGRVVSRSWCNSSGWDVPNPNSGTVLDGRD